MQLLNPLSTNSLFDVHIEMVVFNPSTMYCARYISLLKNVIQFEWQWLHRILCNCKTQAQEKS